MRNFLKKNWSNVVFIMVFILLIVPQTRSPIQVFVQRVIAFSPSEISEVDRVIIKDLDWRLNTMEGAEKNLSSSNNKVILINFWATWCPPCIAEMPSLQELFEDYRGKVDFYFVTQEDPSVIQKFMNEKNYNFPVYIERFAPPHELTSKSLPTTFIISKSGEIVVRKTGVANWYNDKVEEILNDLLSQ